VVLRSNLQWRLDRAITIGGKAEWIKFLGALYGLEAKETNTVFQLKKNITTLAFVKATIKPTILYGALYQQQWYVPRARVGPRYFLKMQNQIIFGVILKNGVHHSLLKPF
jgi:hypothetical protein